MLRRAVNSFLDRQAWADGLGEWLQNFYLAILRPVPAIKDLLHGTWLGHALHPVITDVPVGAFTAAIVLDVIGLNADAGVLRGADWATLVGYVTMLAAAVTGIADYTGTYGRDRRHATIHSLLMFTSAALYLVSVLVRFGVIGGTPQSAFTLALIGYLILAVGAYIGGQVVYDLGYMVDRHAWESTEGRWQALDRTEFAEGEPTRAIAGDDAVLIVRRGETLYAIHDTCAHAGCSLSEGKLVSGGGQIECGCHGSRFDLRSGRVARGPSTFDQPRFEVRRQNGAVEVRRRAAAGEP